MLKTCLGAGGGRGLPAKRGACRFSGYFAAKFHFLGDVFGSCLHFMQMQVAEKCKQVEEAAEGDNSRTFSVNLNVVY